MKTKLEDVEEEEDEYVAMVYEADELANAETSSSIADMDVECVPYLLASNAV